MKKIITLLFIFLFSHFSAFAREITLTRKSVIEKVNLEDQTLSVDGMAYLLAPETRVLTKNNQLVSVTSLQKGHIIEFIMDNKNPNKKMITQIKILSDVPKELTNH